MFNCFNVIDTLRPRLRSLEHPTVQDIAPTTCIYSQINVLGVARAQFPAPKFHEPWTGRSTCHVGVSDRFVELPNKKVLLIHATHKMKRTKQAVG